MIPKKITDQFPDLDIQSISNLLSLSRVCKTSQCSIALGAGVSQSAGLPSWDKLLRKIAFAYFDHWTFAIATEENKLNFLNPPKNISIAFTNGYDLSELEETNAFSMSEILNSLVTDDFSNIDVFSKNHKWEKEKVQALFQSISDANEMKSTLQSDFLNGLMDIDPLLVAQIIKNRIKEQDWDYLLRKSLYNSYENRPYRFIISPLMESCIKLIVNLKVNKIINYNYDDTMYHALIQNGVNCQNVYSDKVKSLQPLIYYPHGYIPLKGGVKTEIILAEQEYQKQSAQVDLWSNNIQMAVYNNSTCIFLGLSLRDPNLRRILNICNKTTKKNHFAFLPKSIGETMAPRMIDALFDSDLLRFGIKVIRYPVIENDHKRLPELLNTVLKAVSGEIQLG